MLLQNKTALIYGGGNMKLAGKAVLVTGANRGIGRALVEEALRKGAIGHHPMRSRTEGPWTRPCP